MMSMFMILHLKAYSIAVVKRRRILKIFGGLIEKYSLMISWPMLNIKHLCLILSIFGQRPSK